jgi:enamine deaminase RidA (YjgF/YER057c/UK114 family)
VKEQPSSSDLAPRPVGGYRQFVSAPAGSSLLFVSGQIGETVEGVVPESGREQCALAWRNVIHQLEAAGFAAHDLIKATVYLTSAELLQPHQEARDEIVGSLQPALSVIVVSRLADPRWRIEIEVVAARMGRRDDARSCSNSGDA